MGNLWRIRISRLTLVLKGTEKEINDLAIDEANNKEVNAHQRYLSVIDKSNSVKIGLFLERNTGFYLF